MASERVHLIRSFEFDGNDLLVAFKRAVDKVFGPDALIGEKLRWWQPRGPVPFTFVKTGSNQKIKVVTGGFDIRGLGQFMIDESTVQVVVKKEDVQRTENFLDEVGRILNSESIYKGKTITSAREFFNIGAVDFSRLNYNPQVEKELNEHLFVLLERTAECRADGLPIQRKVLFEGKFGTGKTMAALLTVKKAIENGFTCFYMDPTQHDVSTAIPFMLRLCKKYMPAVLVIEDFDREQDSYRGDGGMLAKIMVAIDGVLSKDSEIIIVLTTNFGTKVKGGFKRPGRIDKVINFDVFSADDANNLLRLSIPDNYLSPDINWDRVGNACSHMAPAFIRGIADTAKLAARSRAGTSQTPIITQDILLSAIEGLQAQHKACEAEMRMGFSQNK